MTPERILIVEDDSKITAAVRDHLGRYGFDARLISDFERVETEFLEFRPHLVVMDVNLPFQDGFTSPGACGGTRARRSSSCRRAPARRTRYTGWRVVATTT